MQAGWDTPADLPWMSLQCRGNIYKDKYSWADFRDVVSNKKDNEIICYILIGFIIFGGCK